MSTLRRHACRARRHRDGGAPLRGLSEYHHTIFATFIALGVVFLLAGLVMLVGGIVSAIHPIVQVRPPSPSPPRFHAQGRRV